MSSYVSKEEIAKAKDNWNVMDYVERYEMDLFTRVGNSFQHKDHSSFWIYIDKKDGQYHYNWHSRGLAGTRALSYLTDCKNMSLPDAVHMLNGSGSVSTKPIKHNIDRLYDNKKDFVLPPNAHNCKRVYAYLTSRGISRNVLNYCLHNKILYESDKYHNCVFVGNDNTNKPVCASLKGTLTPQNGGHAFSGLVNNSNKEYTFRIINDTKKIHCFEAAIDALSWLSIQEMKGVSWERLTVISAEGVTGIKPTNDGKIPNNDAIPAILPMYLKNIVEQVGSDKSEFVVHYDNDFCGEVATIKTIKALNELGFKAYSSPSPKGKDWNDYLKAIKHLDVSFDAKQVQDKPKINYKNVER